MSRSGRRNPGAAAEDLSPVGNPGGTPASVALQGCWPGRSASPPIPGAGPAWLAAEDVGDQVPRRARGRGPGAVPDSVQDPRQVEFGDLDPDQPAGGPVVGAVRF